MPLKIYNYLSKKVEEFKPIKNGEVGLYTCGPTVYDYVHIGNWRTFIFEDILKRVLMFNGYKVKHIINLTDIDDKIIKKSRELGIKFRELTAKYEKAFFEDLTKLNIVKADKYTRATEYIDEMINLILKLLDRGVAYKGEDGIYFSVDKFPNYGKLSGLEKRVLKKGARVNDDQYDKENWSDFALWMFPQPSSSPGLEPSWDAPFGKGRPGWHIECSAMSIAKLGESFDIHTGGVDLLFPHHENEIAQNEAATGAKFVNYWMEGEHLLVEGEKMSKSLNNFYKISDVVAKGFDPLALRYLFLTAHYRSKLNFTWESLEAAQNALNNLREEVANWDKPNIGCAGYENDFRSAINDDLDMPKALSVMWEMAKSDYPTSAKHQSVLVMDQVLGLGLDTVSRTLSINLSETIKVSESLRLEGKFDEAKRVRTADQLAKERDRLRAEGKFDEADEIRKTLNSLGTVVRDTPQGTVLITKEKKG